MKICTLIYLTLFTYFFMFHLFCHMYEHFFFNYWVVFHCIMYCILFIHSLADRHFNCFQLLVTINLCHDHACSSLPVGSCRRSLSYRTVALHLLHFNIQVIFHICKMANNMKHTMILNKY